MDKTVYDLTMHETLEAEMKWGVRHAVTRVATGWIYQPIIRHKDGKDEYLVPVFVPTDNVIYNYKDKQ
jgi:hypothetical protein